MLNLLNSLLSLLTGLILILWDAIEQLSSGLWEILYHLHVSAPRLEGLLIGITLSWLMLRRDRHPLLRVLSSPLKLILDILDLGWDQCVEIVKDVWGVVKNWAMIPVNWSWNKVKWAWDRLLNILMKFRDKLRSSKGD